MADDEANKGVDYPGPGITEGQAKWAAQHDWYHSHHNGTLHARDVNYYPKTKTTTEEMKSFRHFGKLKEWAGY